MLMTYQKEFDVDMNTAAVAKELGVSTSTIKRWVKQLGLSMEKNEMGHFSYKEEDIETLRMYQVQTESLKALQEVASAKDPRIAMVQISPSNHDNDQLLQKLDTLEQLINSKADQVVAYQLFQHRKEINELTTIIEKLNERIQLLEAHQNTIKLTENPPEEAVFLPRRPRRPTTFKFFQSFRKHSS